MMKVPSRGGGWQAVRYTWRKAREVGGVWKLWQAMRSKNACKTCALGMGGQRGGMVNELGHFPEVCKKSLQAMAADMQGAIEPKFYQTYSIAQLQRFSSRELEACGRIATPLLYVRGEDHYQPITWEGACARIVGKLKSVTPDETFFYFSGRSSNEAGFLLQLFARAYGTNNVNNCSYYCHQASSVGLSTSLGTGTATLLLEDVERADLVFVWGGNPASNHPRLMRTLMQVRRAGGKVIVVNPVIETGLVNFSVPSDVRSLLFGSEIANLTIQPHIGGDLALLTGLAKRILEMDAMDEEFVAQYTKGWPQLKARLESVPWDEIVEKSGTEKAELDQMAELYAKARHAVFSWTMGITHHQHGVRNVQAIANLALMRGMVGRPNAGLLPIRGHSNVQGIGSMGVTPTLKQAVFDRLEQHFQLKLPVTTGLDTMACMEGAEAGRQKVAFCLGGNLYGSNPDLGYAARSLSNLEQLVYLNTTLNTGHAHALAAETIILPVLARDEELQPTTQESMFNYVRLSDGGPARHQGLLSEVQVIAAIARGVLGDEGPIPWSEMENHGRIRAAIAAIVPGYEAIAQIAEKKLEFQIGGRTFHEPKFPTADGRAQLHVHDLPGLRGGGSELRLMTVRSEGQFNTVVYEDYDLYRGQERRDVVLLHPDDIRRLGLQADQRVTVHGEGGTLAGQLVRAFEKIKPGNALMYYPEANAVLPRNLDPLSKTPAFKGSLIRLEATPATTRSKSEA